MKRRLHSDDNTMDESQRMFDAIYGQVISEIFGEGINGAAALWLRVVRHAGEVARAIRKEDDPLLICELPQLFCWYCALCTSLGISVENSVWRFFPGVCPTCYLPICGCGPAKERSLKPLPKQKEPELLRKFGEQNGQNRPRTLDGYVGMFERIYGSHNEAAHIDNIFLHFMEELGEVATLIQMLAYLRPEAQRALIVEQLSSELADVFSWICRLRRNADSRMARISDYFGIAMPEMALSVLVNKLYGRGCPECKRRQCTSHCPGWNRWEGGDQLIR